MELQATKNAHFVHRGRKGASRASAVPPRFAGTARSHHRHTCHPDGRPHLRTRHRVHHLATDSGKRANGRTRADLLTAATSGVHRQMFAPDDLRREPTLRGLPPGRPFAVPAPSSLSARSPPTPPRSADTTAPAKTHDTRLARQVSISRRLRICLSSGILVQSTHLLMRLGGLLAWNGILGYMADLKYSAIQIKRLIYQLARREDPWLEPWGGNAARRQALPTTGHQTTRCAIRTLYRRACGKVRVWRWLRATTGPCKTLLAR